MDKFIAVVFDTEADAFKGGEALNDLQRKGDVVIYAEGVISKDADGNVALNRAADEGPIGTAFGLLMGAMVGVLAGPAAVATGAAVAGSAAAASAAAGGMAFGSATGGLMGMYRDLWTAGIDATVLDQISIELKPGKSCLVASLDEVWTTPLDTRMGELGGTLYRKPRVDVVDDQMAAEMAELDRELDELDAELNQVADDVSDKVKSKIDATKAKIRETGVKIDNRMVEMDAEFEARIAALDEQIANAADEKAAKFKKRKEELQADWAERKAKLKEAGSLAASAFAK